jgi:hypothetical protein
MQTIDDCKSVRSAKIDQAADSSKGAYGFLTRDHNLPWTPKTSCKTICEGCNILKIKTNGQDTQICNILAVLQFENLKPDFGKSYFFPSQAAEPEKDRIQQRRSNACVQSLIRAGTLECPLGWGSKGKTTEGSEVRWASEGSS